jgi:catechol 2,3-dioxygenase-like lactoylglutathione lyase family enzyme
VTTRPQVAIYRVTMIVSDPDRAEHDYVKTFGCRVEQRGDLEPSLIHVLCHPLELLAFAPGRIPEGWRVAD